MEKRSRPGFDAVFPAALAVALAAVAFVLHTRHFPLGDIDIESDFYGSMLPGAKRLAAGSLSVADHPYKGPLYAIALLPFRALAGSWYTGAVALNLTCGAALLVVVYRLFLGLRRRPVAIAAMLLTATIVEFALQAQRASTDVLFLLLAVSSVALLCRPRPASRDFLVAGALGGLAFLTRYNGVFLPVGAVAACFLVGHGCASVRRRAAAAGLYVAAFLVVCAPWFGASLAQTGRLLATENLQNIEKGLDPAGFDPDRAGGRYADLRELVGHDPGGVALRYVHNLGAHFAGDMSRLLGVRWAVPALLGLMVLPFAPPTRRQATLYVFALVYALLMGVVFYHERFFLFMIVPYAALVTTPFFGTGGRRLSRPGAWVAGAWARLRARHARLRDPRLDTGVRRLAVALFALLIVLQVGDLLDRERDYHARRPLYCLAAGAFLGEQATASGRPVVMSRKAHIADLADCDWRPFIKGAGSLYGLLTRAAADGVTHVFWSPIEMDLLPDFRFLAVMEDVPGLDLVYDHEGSRIFALEPLVDPEGLAGRCRDAEAAMLGENLFFARAHGVADEVLTAAGRLAVVQMRDRDYGAAIPSLELALQASAAAGEEGRQERENDLRLRLGVCLASVGRIDEGVGLLERELSAAVRDGDAPRQAELHELLGRIRDATGDPQAADGHFAQARRLFLQAGRPERAAALPR